MFAIVTHRWLPFAAAVLLAACAAHSPPDAMGKMDKTKAPTLYERLGGQPAIDAVVDDFVANVAADPRINRFFANSNIPGSSGC